MILSSLLSRLRHATAADLARAAARVAAFCAPAALVMIVAGLAVGLVLAPATVQGEVSRVAVLHGPAAGVALGIYALLAALAIATLRQDSRTAPVVAAALLPTGLLFTLLALWTEALWRRPLQGAWWVWDARSMAQLMLLFLYGGALALRALLDDPRRADRAAALFVLLGLGNLPILYFSLHWWDQLRHVRTVEAPPMGAALAVAEALVTAGFACYAAQAAARRVRCLVAERDAAAREVRRLMENVA